MGILHVCIFSRDVDANLEKAEGNMFAFLGIWENSLAGRHLLPLPDTERKHKTRETYLTTAARERQRRQSGSPAVAVSARNSSSQLKSSEVWEGVNGGEEAEL